MQRRGDESIRAGSPAPGRVCRAAHASDAARRPPVRKRRVPRREIEARRQRMVRWGVAVAGIAMLVILVGGMLYENVIKPNQTLATVGSVIDLPPGLLEMAGATTSSSRRSNTRISPSSSVRTSRGNTSPWPSSRWPRCPRCGAAPTSTAASLQAMIEDQIYLQGLDDLGLEMTPDEIETFALNRFAPPGAPLIPPSPTPTSPPSARPWPPAPLRRCRPRRSPRPLAGTPAAGTPIAALPRHSRDTSATPLAAVPTVSPAHAETPREARATAEAGYRPVRRASSSVRRTYARGLRAVDRRARPGAAEGRRCAGGAGSGRARRRFTPRTSCSRRKRRPKRLAPASIEGGEAFATVAREVSTDEGTAGNGGDLGWFTREEMVAPFAEAAFALEPGAISEPVEYGVRLACHRGQGKRSRSPADRHARSTGCGRRRSSAGWKSSGPRWPITSTLPPAPTP